jgi:hypothetical protein
MQPIPIQVVPVPLQGFVASVHAGFPSPAADHAQKYIDLNEHLIRNKEATFLFRVRGDSMTGIGIYEADTLLVCSVEMPLATWRIAIMNIIAICWMTVFSPIQ